MIEVKCHEDYPLRQISYSRALKQVTTCKTWRGRAYAEGIKIMA
jgi:hypothetical protein